MCQWAVVFYLLHFSWMELRRHTRLNIFMLSFSRLRRPFLVIFLSNQHRCGHRMVRAPVVRGVADSIEKFVLICPLGKSSGGISWILLQMFHCVCMLGIGVGWLWSKWKHTAEGLQHGGVEALLREQIRNRSHLRIFPGSPAESTFCDQRHGNTTARRLDPSLSWHSLQPFGISSGNSRSRCQQWQTTNACILPPTEFIFISTLLYHQPVVSPHTGFSFECKKIIKQSKPNKPNNSRFTAGKSTTSLWFGWLQQKIMINNHSGHHLRIKLH